MREPLIHIFKPLENNDSITNFLFSLKMIKYISLLFSTGSLIFFVGSIIDFMSSFNVEILDIFYILANLFFLLGSLLMTYESFRSKENHQQSDNNKIENTKLPNP